MTGRLRRGKSEIAVEEAVVRAILLTLGSEIRWSGVSQEKRRVRGGLLEMRKMVCPCTRYSKICIVRLPL